jgi:hypothetical protein
MTDNSTLVLQARNPAEVIRPEALADYERCRDPIWNRLVRLHSTVFVLDKVLRFPFHVFEMPGASTFWVLLVQNFGDVVTLLLTALTSDGQGYTIKRFKNDVAKKWLHPDFREDLRATLACVRFDAEVGRLMVELVGIRNHLIAHIDEKYNLVPTDEIVISIEQVQRAVNSLVRLFDVLCFGIGHHTLPIDYSRQARRPVGLDARADIERLLDYVARHSKVLDMPEEQPDFWPHYRSQLSEGELEVINKYRRKFGLPEA